ATSPPSVGARYWLADHLVLLDGTARTTPLPHTWGRGRRVERSDTRRGRGRQTIAFHFGIARRRPTSLLELPPLHGFVGTGGGERLAVGAKRNADHGVGVVLEHGQFLTALGVEDAGGLVGAAGRDLLAVGAERNGRDRSLVPGQLPDELAGLGGEDLNLA